MILDLIYYCCYLCLFTYTLIRELKNNEFVDGQILKLGTLNSFGISIQDFFKN